MKKLNPPFNSELIEILDEFIEWFYSQDLTQLKYKGEADETEYYTSQEYYDSIDWETHIGFPLSSHGVDLCDFGATPDSWREKVRKTQTKICNILSAKITALLIHYPPNGYIGWHDNRNCPGYNIIITHTQNGNGFFRYFEDGKIITVKDEPGWNIKYGYYGNFEEKEKQFRHCAHTKEDRFTLGFVIPDKNMWEMAIEELCEE